MTRKTSSIQSRFAAKAALNTITAPRGFEVLITKQSYGRECAIYVPNKHNTNWLQAYYEALGNRAPVFYETAECIGLHIHAKLMSQYFDEEEANKATIAEPSEWIDAIVMVKQDEQVQRIGIRICRRDTTVHAYRPAYGDDIRLSALEAALTRSALSWQGLNAYAYQHGKGDNKVARINGFHSVTADGAAQNAWTAKMAADILSLSNVYRVLD